MEVLEKHPSIDIHLIMVPSALLETQKNILLAAAKSKGLKRVVPSEFAIVYSPGVISNPAFDKQLEIRALVKDLKLPYTYINVGWWMDLILPRPGLAAENNIGTQRSRISVGSEKVKTAVTARNDIGRFISRIIQDPRTLITHVFCYGDEVTLEEVYEIAEKVLEKNLRSKYIHEEELWTRLQELRRNYRRSPNRATLGFQTGYECFDAMYIRGLNTVDMAKEFGALDARVLYPDFKPASLEEFAEQFYKQLPDIHVSEAI